MYILYPGSQKRSAITTWEPSLSGGTTVSHLIGTLTHKVELKMKTEIFDAIAQAAYGSHSLLLDLRDEPALLKQYNDVVERVAQKGLKPEYTPVAVGADVNANGSHPVPPTHLSAQRVRPPSPRLQEIMSKADAAANGGKDQALAPGVAVAVGETSAVQSVEPAPGDPASVVIAASDVADQGQAHPAPASLLH